MSVSFIVDPVQQRILARADGVLTLQELLNYQREINARPECVHFTELFDLTAVEDIVGVSLEGLKHLALLAAAHDPADRPARLAIVANQDVFFRLESDV